MQLRTIGQTLEQDEARLSEAREHLAAHSDIEGLGGSTGVLSIDVLVRDVCAIW
jgi:hypothetical protein